jgi:hypothetical protein
MIKYCYIKNEETGLAKLGVGCDNEFYKSIGMKQRDVEQSEVDNKWYLTNKCPHYTDKEKLTLIKESKLQQALGKANDFINNTATYRDIECTDNNIGKLSAYYMALSAGVWETADWTTKNDNKIQLTAEDVQDILLGIANVQSDVWTRQYLEYVEMINNAQTVEELEKIEIEYKI